jgi:hypothetical protein
MTKTYELKPSDIPPIKSGESLSKVAAFPAASDVVKALQAARDINDENSEAVLASLEKLRTVTPEQFCELNWSVLDETDPFELEAAVEAIYQCAVLQYSGSYAYRLEPYITEDLPFLLNGIELGAVRLLERLAEESTDGKIAYMARSYMHEVLMTKSYEGLRVRFDEEKPDGSNSDRWERELSERISIAHDSIFTVFDPDNYVDNKEHEEAQRAIYALKTKQKARSEAVETGDEDIFAPGRTERAIVEWMLNCDIREVEPYVLNNVLLTIARDPGSDHIYALKGCIDKMGDDAGLFLNTFVELEQGVEFGPWIIDIASKYEPQNAKRIFEDLASIRASSQKLGELIWWTGMDNCSAYAAAVTQAGYWRTAQMLMPIAENGPSHTAYPALLHATAYIWDQIGSRLDGEFKLFEAREDGSSTMRSTDGVLTITRSDERFGMTVRVPKEVIAQWHEEFGYFEPGDIENIDSKTSRVNYRLDNDEHGVAFDIASGGNGAGMLSREIAEVLAITDAKLSRRRAVQRAMRNGGALLNVVGAPGSGNNGHHVREPFGQVSGLNNSEVFAKLTRAMESRLLAQGAHRSRAA